MQDNTKSPAQNKANRLLLQKSPYLLQHAFNPVDWHPWGEEAFARARAEDKPIFLSIGYSTCHWCHVMERESFEDQEVARLMNEAFVCIKVDREERPDIDAVYMTAAQLMNNQGGWPLTVIMTPDKKPFFVETYLPKETRFGKMGLMQMIPMIRKHWLTSRDKVNALSGQVADALRIAATPETGKEVSDDVFNQAFHKLSRMFDERYGGFGSAPKFPTPHILNFLLRYYRGNGNEAALFMVEKTLTAMRCGGIFDQVGFGFHRYSTDQVWLVPHYEKMLYDQALLLTAYVEAYEATGKEIYQSIAQEIVEYVLRDMTSAEGGFYSAEDADSEGEEGKFYLWSESEIRSALGHRDAELMIGIFNVHQQGNFIEQGAAQSRGLNILHLQNLPADLMRGLGITEKALKEKIEAARKILFAVREERVHPFKDDKILTDWNGLMIAALARAGAVFDNQAFIISAERAVQFILDKMRDKAGRLLHRYREGEAGVSGALDDYAFLIHGLIELYEATFNPDYLREALGLAREMIGHFHDETGRGFFRTADDAEQVLVRDKESFDSAVPSGNSIAMLDLLRLARMTGDAGLEEIAAGIGRAFAGRVEQAPAGHTQMLIALDMAFSPGHQVVLVGDAHAEDTKQMIKALRRSYSPHKVILFKPADDAGEEIAAIAEFTKELRPVQGQATAYLCRNYQCELPITDPNELAKALAATQNKK